MQIYTRQLSKLTQVCSLCFLFLIFLASNSIAQGSFDEWETITKRRVNLRANASTTSAIITTLNEDDILTVIGESPGWVNVKTANNQTGWVSDTFIVNKNIILKIKPEPEIIEIQKPADDTQSNSSIDSIGFTSQSEPNTNNASGTTDGSMILLTLLLVISIVGNILLYFRLRTNEEQHQFVGESKTLQQDYKHQLKVNQDLRDQIKFSEEKVKKQEKEINNGIEKQTNLRKVHEEELVKQKNKYSILDASIKKDSEDKKSSNESILKSKNENIVLSKQVESLKQKINENADTSQQKSVNYALSEKTNKETHANLQHELSTSKNLMEDTKNRLSNLESEFNEKESDWETVQNKLSEKINSLESSLGEFEINKENELKHIHEKNISEINSVNKELDYLKRLLDESNSTINDLNNTIKENESKMSKFIDVQQPQNEDQKEVFSDQFVTLKDDYESLLNKFDKKGNEFSKSRNEWIDERNDLLYTIEELKNTLIKVEDVTEILNKPPVIETLTETIPIVEKVTLTEKSDAEVDESYDDYAKHFFNTMRKL